MDHLHNLVALLSQWWISTPVNEKAWLGVGFLAQLIVGIESRLLPLAGWLQAFAAGGYRDLPPSVHTAHPRSGALAAVVLWSAGVPAIAAGLSLDRPAWVSFGGAAAALGVLTTAVSAGWGLRRLRSAGSARG